MTASIYTTKKSTDEIVQEYNELLLDKDGRIKLLPFHFYYNNFSSYDRNPEKFKEYRIWCNKTARYGIPTIELILTLKHLIGTREAIEIGSGNGDIYYHLNILGTDSFIQSKNQLVNDYYKIVGQPITKPREDVEEIEAIRAVLKYKPQVVIGSYITQKGNKDIPDSNEFGVNEERLLRLADYIMLGNQKVHGRKIIMKYEHEVIKYDQCGAYTRTPLPHLACLYIWKRQHKGFSK